MTRTDCRMHGGPDEETRIVAIMPCAPGWRLAHPPWGDEDVVWFDPIAAFAQTENGAGLCAGCTCPQRRVTALIAGSHGDLELAEDDTRVVPPGFAVEWSKADGWALRDPTDPKARA